uniref:Uncharacterized protein n=1 Tax=Arundo donax TaxID=35708 RepID=A0A0A9DSJ4_ARUDO
MVSSNEQNTCKSAYLDVESPPSWDSTSSLLTDVVELDDVPISWSPYTKLTILRVMEPGEMVSTGTVFGLFVFLFCWGSLFLFFGSFNGQFPDSWCPKPPH